MLRFPFLHRWLLLAIIAPICCILVGAASVGAGEATAPTGVRLNKGGRVVFFGDSIIHDGIAERGFQTLLASLLKEKHAALGIELINAGVSGDKVTDLLARVDQDVVGRRPTVVVISIGINDVWRGKDGTPHDRYETVLRELAVRFAKNGIPIVLCTPSAIGEKKSGANPFDRQLDDYAAIVRKVAAEKNAVVVDLRKAFSAYHDAKNTSDAAAGLLTKDGVHFNDAGNRLFADHLARALGIGPLGTVQAPATNDGKTLEARPLGPRWIFRDGDRLYWNGSSHSQDEGWQCSIVEFYLRTRFPSWKVTSGRGGPTGVSATGTADIIARFKPTVVFCEFGYYGADNQVSNVKEAEALLKLCRDKNVTLVMMPSAFRAAHINRLPPEYKGLNETQIAELNERKKKDGTLEKMLQEVPVQISETHWRMRGAPGCDKRVESMQEWGDRIGVQVPRSYQDQRDWLLKVWESDPKFPWGGGHPPVAGYMAVGYFLLQRMEAPIPESRLVLNAAGAEPKAEKATACTVSDLVKTEHGIQFRRLDKVLPVIPPVSPERLPREPCPMLKYSPYFLTVAGLNEGHYEIVVEKVLLGHATQAELAAGVNLNAISLRSAFKDSSVQGVSKLPWSRLWTVCRDKNIDKDPAFGPHESVGTSSWLWEIRRKTP